MIDWEATLDLKRVRRTLGLSQRRLACMLGVSPRTVQSCEQGWRKPSPALEKSLLLLLLAQRLGPALHATACWEARACDERERQDCIVFRTGQGHLCWLLSGNVCGGKSVRTWAEKKVVCGKCELLVRLVRESEERAGADAPASPG